MGTDRRQNDGGVTATTPPSFRRRPKSILLSVPKASNALTHPDGGSVTIRIGTAGAPKSAPAATEPPVEGRTVFVTVTDTGHGIPEDVLPRIFEPFFTTKGEHGTGLGLATVLRAIREAGAEA